jgi:hypothetical protein
VFFYTKGIKGKGIIFVALLRSVYIFYPQAIDLFSHPHGLLPETFGPGTRCIGLIVIPFF